MTTAPPGTPALDPKRRAAVAAIATMVTNAASGVGATPAPPARKPPKARARRSPTPPDAPSPIQTSVIEACAKLDHSDVSNAQRLLAHFGADLRVLRMADCPSPPYVGWTGTHWDMERGPLIAMTLAQKIGDLIKMEVKFLSPAAAEQNILDEVQAVPASPAMDGPVTPAQRDLAIRGKAILAGIESLQEARRRFAVSSKNRARIQAMLDLAAPYHDVAADDFNVNAYKVVTLGHTLTFRPCSSPREPGDDAIMTAVAGHDRADLITRLVPVAYDPKATCPQWEAWLARFQPDTSVRRALQLFSGLGLLGVTVQRLAFHYGTGANGKSVFLQTMMRVLGPLAVDLPAESISGDTSRSAGGASPDLARLYGARFVRVAELPKDKPLDEEMIKRLTGGETIDVRQLFKGYFSFSPCFTVHTSGNGYPRIDGTDHGIWRRIMVVPWTVTVPLDEQIEFETMLARFAPEYAGILNWLIAGALMFLNEGLVLPDPVLEATRDYREDMDPVAGFVQACVIEVTGHSVYARVMYQAYVSWAVANSIRPVSERRFALAMRGKVMKIDHERLRRYVDCDLRDVPDSPCGYTSSEARDAD